MRGIPGIIRTSPVAPYRPVTPENPQQKPVIIRTWNDRPMRSIESIPAQMRKTAAPVPVKAETPAVDQVDGER